MLALALVYLGLAWKLFKVVEYRARVSGNLGRF
jgi:hypothetical protein